jgi:hypothetical protein
MLIQVSLRHTVQSGMKQHTQHVEGPVPLGWSTASFRISTADGWLDVDGFVRPPFGIDQRSIDHAEDRGWFVTHLPSGLAVVTQIRPLAVALAFVDRIAGLTEWTAQTISATSDLRERVREALNHAYGDFHADRLPVLPQDTLPAPRS